MKLPQLSLKLKGDSNDRAYEVVGNASVYRAYEQARKLNPKLPDRFRAYELGKGETIDSLRPQLSRSHILKSRIEKTIALTFGERSFLFGWWVWRRVQFRLLRLFLGLVTGFVSFHPRINSEADIPMLPTMAIGVT